MTHRPRGGPHPTPKNSAARPPVPIPTKETGAPIIGNFRKSVDPDELIANTDPAVLEPHRTTYQASRGGYFPEPDKPVPGAPLEGERSS